MAIIQREWEFHSDTGTQIKGRRWTAEAPKAHVMIVHGLSDHIARYHDFAMYLAGQGFDVVGYDQCGHGNSGGLRGHAAHFDVLVEDLAQTFQQQLANVELPRFLYGHSMGGSVALNFALKKSTEPEFHLDGLIASAPLLRPAHPIPRWKHITANTLHLVFPSLRFSTEIDPNDLTHDPRVAEELEKDPHWHCKVSARLGVEMLAAGEWALANAELIKVPTLIIHGDQDVLTSLAASREFSQRNRQHCRLIEFPSMRHELHVELEKLSVWETVDQWLSEQTNLIQTEIDEPSNGQPSSSLTT